MSSTMISNNATLAFVSTLRNKMNKHKFMLAYRGMISQETVKTLLNLTEKKLDSDHTEVGVKKKIFHVMMNCLETICKSTKEEQRFNSSIFMIGREEDSYVIYSGRVIEKNKGIALKEIIEEINKLSKEELKELYISNLISSKKGLDANKDISNTDLSLIDIAKKTGQKLAFDLEEINDESSFFSLQSKIINA
jgi:hypothetical protein